MVSDFIIDEVYKFLSKYFKGSEVGGCLEILNAKYQNAVTLSGLLGRGFFWA